MSEIQSVTFRKNSWSLSEAKRWLRKYKMMTILDEKSNTYRYRQEDPSNFSRFITKVIYHKNKPIDLIIGFH
jgi:predicted metal-binding protein